MKCGDGAIRALQICDVDPHKAICGVYLSLESVRWAEEVQGWERSVEPDGFYRFYMETFQVPIISPEECGSPSSPKYSKFAWVPLDEAAYIDGLHTVIGEDQIRSMQSTPGRSSSRRGRSKLSTLALLPCFLIPDPSARCTGWPSIHRHLVITTYHKLPHCPAAPCLLLSVDQETEESSDMDIPWSLELATTS